MNEYPSRETPARMKDLRSAISDVLGTIPVDFGGGCSLSKAYVMASLIRLFDLKTTIDIGVYRGRSLFPQALAHSLCTGGMVYGVDPWSSDEAKERDNPAIKDKIDDFISRTDFQEIYTGVMSLIERSGVRGHCTVLRKTSADAVAYFRQHDVFFDLIHIDGNHDTARVMEDVSLYAPRSRQNGFIIVDDISWDSVKPAYRYFTKTTSLLFERVDGANDYAVFRNGGSLLSNLMLKAYLLYHGNH